MFNPLFDTEEDAWRSQANCRGINPGVFFPEQGDDVKRIKKICAECPVPEECAMYAIENNIWEGWWGGMSDKKRREYRKQLLEEQEHGQEVVFIIKY